jgi:large conductance mechanosensitive channel
MLRDFKLFLVKQNALALAIGVVIGAALTKVVTALVDDIIMPIIAVAQPGGEWQKATLDVGPFHFLVGDLANAIINFLIIGFVVWRISKFFIKPDPAAPTRVCPFCRMTLDAAATRCAHCTSQLTPA